MSRRGSYIGGSTIWPALPGPGFSPRKRKPRTTAAPKKKPKKDAAKKPDAGEYNRWEAKRARNAYAQPSRSNPHSEREMLFRAIDALRAEKRDLEMRREDIVARYALDRDMSGSLAREWTAFKEDQRAWGRKVAAAERRRQRLTSTSPNIGPRCKQR